MDKLQNMKEHCDVCHVPVDYDNGTLTLEQCRLQCAHCRRFGKSGIYKFDIAYTMRKRSAKLPPGKGKTASRYKQYGTAVSKLYSEGKTVREIADILGISPTTVCSIRRKLGLY